MLPAGAGELGFAEIIIIPRVGPSGLKSEPVRGVWGKGVLRGLQGAVAGWRWGVRGALAACPGRWGSGAAVASLSLSPVGIPVA